MKEDSTLQQITLQMEIERIREELDNAVLNGLDTSECYELSIKLDSLIEKYLTSGHVSA